MCLALPFVSCLPRSLPHLFSAPETWRALSAGSIWVVIGRHAWVAAMALSSPLMAPHHFSVSCVCVQCYRRPPPPLPPFAAASAAKRMVHGGCGQDYLKNLLKLIWTFFFFIISARSAPHNNQGVCVWICKKPFLCERPLRSVMMVECMTRRQLDYTDAVKAPPLQSKFTADLFSMLHIQLI